MKTINIVLGAVFFVVSTAFSQQPISAPSLTNVLPPAPNAYELTKYSGLSVNHSMGGASASIPVGWVNGKGISVPLSLNYNSGNGVKINQIASRAGMNWVLNAGGVITRTVYNLQDETSSWLAPPANFSTKNQALYDYLDNASLTGLYDTQPDIFNFEFMGKSGRFIIGPNNNSQVTQLSVSPLKIVTNFNNEFTGNWTFRITDELGNQYFFGGSQATETSKTYPFSCGKNFDLPIPTAWYLIGIRSAQGESIWLKYLAVNFEYLADVSQTMIRTPSSTPLNPSCPPEFCPSRTETQVCGSRLVSQGVILKSINSKSMQVRLNYQSRTDVIGDSLLSSIQIYNKANVDTTAVLHTTHTLAYVQSNNTSYYNYFGAGSYATRPFLKTVTTSAAGETSQKHTLNYYNINALASRLSFAQDYWGYFNGQNNENLLPYAQDYTHKALFINLANRTPNGSFAKMGLLSSIVYPTSGRDSIEYEPNTYYGTQYVGGVFVTGNFEAGGVRVFRNISIPVDGLPIEKRFVYASLAQQAQSSGTLRSIPNPANYFIEMEDNTECFDGGISSCMYAQGYSSPIRSLFYNSGLHIYYKNVIELSDAAWANGGTERSYVGTEGSDPYLAMGKEFAGVPVSNDGFDPGVEVFSKQFITTGIVSGSYQVKPLREVSTHYVFDTRRTSETMYYVVKRRFSTSIYSPPNDIMFQPFDVLGYYISTKWMYADTVSTKTYDQNGLNPVLAKTTYQYNNAVHVQPTGITAARSDGKTTKTEIKYAAEMVADGVLTPYQAMVTANRIGIPIIQSESLITGSTPQHIQSVFTQYNSWHTGIIEPQKIQRKTGTGPYLDYITFLAYDSEGNLLTQSQASGPKKGYQYGYRNRLLIAECSNAGADEFYFQNFEDSGSLSATAHTGFRDSGGAFTVNFTKPLGKAYIISYWYKSGSNWLFKTENYTGPSMALSGGTAYDDIAVYPYDGLLSSYTYYPDGRIQSVLDSKSLATYYEYDGFSRLKFIKDHQGNIIKHMVYNLTN